MKKNCTGKNNKYVPTFLVLLLVIVLVSLTACGGGSGGSNKYTMQELEAFAEDIHAVKERDKLKDKDIEVTGVVDTVSYSLFLAADEDGEWLIECKDLSSDEMEALRGKSGETITISGHIKEFARWTMGTELTNCTIVE